MGIGKLRHRLTDALRREGGHGGYAIRPGQRGKGYGKLLLGLLAGEAGALGIGAMLLTIRNENTPSIRTALSQGGVVGEISEERHYIRVPCCAGLPADGPT